MNSFIVKNLNSSDDCDVYLPYYNYLESSYLSNTGKYLNDAL